MGWDSLAFAERDIVWGDRLGEARLDGLAATATNIAQEPFVQFFTLSVFFIALLSAICPHAGVVYMPPRPVVHEGPLPDPDRRASSGAIWVCSRAAARVRVDTLTAAPQPAPCSCASFSRRFF